MKCDLHLHTTASDGRLTPSELVRMAVQKHVEVMAITDHDTVGGIEEAISEGENHRDIKIIPGVEINTDLASGELHILGYFIDHRDSDFVARLEKIQQSRIGRATMMVDKLAKLGMPVSWERVQELAQGESICRPHIAQALMEKGYINREAEAFEKYIGRNGPAYVEREKVKPEEAVEIVARAGGIPVLAHPADIDDLELLVIKLTNAGLIGLEALYGQYDSETRHRLTALAGKHKLIITGGSDYHHFCNDREVMLGSIDIPHNNILDLYKAAGK